MRNSIVVVSLLAILACGCRQPTAISGIVYPQQPLRVNDTFEMSVMLVSPSGDEILRWQAINGKCESKNEHSLSCRYLAERAGEDSVTVEVFRSGRVVAKTSVLIRVEASVSSSGASPVSVGGQDAEVGDLDGVEIDVTEKPPFGKGGPDKTVRISGKVSGIAKPERFNIVIYAHADDVWFVQPFERVPITYIEPEGLWSTKTHLGSEYAILLVLPSYTNPPAKMDEPPRGLGVLKSLTLRNHNE